MSSTDKISSTDKPKTAALKMPSDPLAILSMQNLDRHFGERPVPADILTSRNQKILTDSSQDVIQDIQQDDKQDVQASNNLASNPSRNRDGKTDRQATSRPAKRGEKKSPEALDPVDQALLQKLARDYPDMEKGRSTLISSRLPDEIVERLGLAADLVKKHKKSKQDVITRGLILAFEELVSGGGDVEWYE